MTTASIGKIAKLLVPLMLALAPIAAFGHGTADPEMKCAVAPFNESESADILQEIKLFANARVSARRAIAIAERRGAGAKVVDLSFDGTSPRLAYRVKVLLNGELWEGTIDASTGAPIGDGSTTPALRHENENKSALAAFSAAASIFPKRSPLPSNTAPAKR